MNTVFRLPLLSVAKETASGVFYSRTMAGAAGRTKLLCVDTMNPNVRVMEYAVRGKVPLEAMKIKKELEQVNGHSRSTRAR